MYERILAKPPFPAYNIYLYTVFMYEMHGKVVITR